MPNQITELFLYDDYNLFVTTSFNPWLVILSVSIAIIASFMGFQVAAQAANANPRRKHFSLFIGSFALGAGIWSMHFIGMLAVELCTTVSYQFNLTVLSLIPAIAASWIALNIIIRDEVKFQQLALGGVLVGSGIGTMHYVGMAAMEMAPLLRYNFTIFAISILVAVALATLALWIRFGLKNTKIHWLNNYIKTIISSFVMGAAISSMHYTGMAAARFVLPPGFELSKQTSEVSIYLAMIITAITLTIIFSVLAANLIMRYKDQTLIAANNERRLIATMDTAIDGIITIDEKGIIISVNNAVSTLLGWSREEMIGQNVKMVVPMPDQAHHDSYIDNYIKTREKKIIGSGREVEALTKSGELIPMRLGIGHVELNNQHMFVAFISDLRERKSMENKLRQEEAKLRSLVSNIPGVVYRNKDDIHWPSLFINDEIENLLGYPAQDFLLPEPKCRVGDFVHPDDMKIIEDTNLYHPEGFQVEIRVIDRYKKEKWVLAYGRTIKDEVTNDVYFDGFIMDITERKTMESALVASKEKAEQAAATRSAFLANMSHEIRTPMNAIIGFSDILLDEELEQSHRKHLNTINQSAKSLLHILNDVLDSAKLDKGKFQLEYRDFSLVEEVDSVVSTLWLQAQNKGLAINLNIDKTAQRFYNGVPDRIRQVLTNLVGNSIKFTEQGSITIDIHNTKPDTLHFSITDTGIGMTPPQLATIFDAFAQADESMSRRFGGTGLGTTISKQLVELMGGTISAQSEEGQGSTFEFSIPIKVVKASAKKQVVQAHAELPPLSILVVDDIEQNIDLLSLVLKRHHHTVSVARNGEQALLKMENDCFDVVLMDIQMPVMDGLTASIKRREFEQANDLPKLPIIALTASVLPQDKRSAVEADMNGFANKPIDVNQLISEIARTLDSENIMPEPAVVIPTEQLRVDLDKGIALWGNKTTLFNEIIRFLQQSEEDIAALTLLRNNSDWPALKAIAHKYKGVTGNLALNRLMTMFSDLEQASLHELTEEAATATDAIQLEINSLIDCSNKMGTANNAITDSGGEEVSLQELYTMLLQLEQHVQHNEFDESLLEALESMSSTHSKEIKDIISACNDFDFEVAANRISVLSDTLKSAI
ncbi:MHYT domain-containing protein [Colwellia sp. 4_MG-2023]|uniref:MHYT domain-containing protein n=1 Tax=unclassified Colwellia TaxID=196834 RepID=UPI0026E2491B|nr:MULTISPECIES: MHYT domain-containing protein [unclassified Colwellia]MDO6505860.1 MHYT domain-containing protein [Colwellia sp. 5_MG-2023]MDO6554541.1 MHYT domain-containing protein [Colwellia sp. 4_MG-2023]